MLPISHIQEATEREKWQEFITGQLVEWERDPSLFDDAEIPAPSVETIQLAVRVAERLRDRGIPAPTRIVPDAHGGIVLEREAGRWFDSYRISTDGSVEYSAFEDCRLVKREPLSVS